MTDPEAFAEARLDEESADFEARVAGEIERLEADGVTVTRDELMTDEPPHYVSPFRRPLRDMEAGRRILARHGGKHWCPTGPQDDEWVTYEAGEKVIGVYPCADMLDLLYRWADHPDYEESWRQA